MIIQYNIVVAIVNLLDNSIHRFNKTQEVELTPMEDDLLYNNYHVLHNSVHILDLFEHEVNAYCEALSIDPASIEVDEFEIVSLTDRVDVFFESTEDNQLSLSPTIKCYVYPKYEALKTPDLFGFAYDSTTIIWSWPNDEGYAHYLVEDSNNPDGEASESKIIAQLPVGATSYTETGLTPNTMYTRRLINYTDEQTSIPSESVTVLTNTVNPTQSLEQYVVPKNYDFTSDDSLREIIDEPLEAFQSGIGDGHDLMVYKQMDLDFYQKFKPYLEITGRRFQKETNYEQCNFNYKVCLEAKETIEEQEGEVTFDVNVHPREWITIEHYMYATMPVNVYAKLYATVFLRKEIEDTEPVEITTYSQLWDHRTEFYGNPLNVVFVLDKTRSLQSLPFGDGGPTMKAAVCNCIDAIEAAKGAVTVTYCIISFDLSATNLTGFTNAAAAKAAVNGIAINGGSTNWSQALYCAATSIMYSGLTGQFVTYFFSDGFPNHRFSDTSSECYRGSFGPSIPGAVGYWDEDALLADLQVYANVLKSVCGKVACLISNYGGGDYCDRSSSPDTGYHATYINACHATVATDYGGVLTWNSAAEMQQVFLSYIQQFVVEIHEFLGYEEHTETIYQPYSIDNVKVVQVETPLLGPFTFDKDITPIQYDHKEQRAVVNSSKFIPPFTAKMSNINVYDLILNEVKKTSAWANGWNKTIGTTDGSFLVKGLFIKDTYAYGNEDIMDDTTFDVSDLEDGMVGSVNVYTDTNTAGTSIYGDDCYLVSKNNYVYIDGYTEGILYDGTRFVTTELNSYDHPAETLIDSNADYRSLLSNRKNESLLYTGKHKDIASAIEIIEIGDDIWLEGYFGLVKAGDKILIDSMYEDLIAHNDAQYNSPILNYRFNLEDPDAKTALYEILPDCNPDSNYLHVVILHVYYAKNVWITNKDNYVEQFSSDPLATLSSSYIPLTEHLYKWTLKEWQHGTGTDNGWYIDEWLWFMAKPMKKTQDYYDELPGENMESFYGMVNSRYGNNEVNGKSDLVVDTPQFNIPTTVHKDTIKIYIMITEFHPETSLVSYKWEHPYDGKNSITQVNGDYVTFSSDSVTTKDVEYLDIVSTMDMASEEIYGNKPIEKMFEISKPEAPYEYTDYFLRVHTDNSDVIALRYPTEVVFDENNKAVIGATFKGVVNSTSQWAPRIHNGYYYLNQHEYFAYSEFDVEANFDTEFIEDFKSKPGYLCIDVMLRRKAPAEVTYDITKNTRSELMQNEEEFQWVDNKGLTLKPFVDGEYYRKYLTYTYYSPVIMFENPLTDPGELTVDYYYEDGSTYLPMFIRSFIIDENKWSEWTPFTNGTKPTQLSSAYQLKMDLQASVQDTDLYLEDYLCCYLDWKDDMDVPNTTNIVTITDHMIAGPDNGDGVYVSRIIDFGCETSLSLDIFDSKYSKDVQVLMVAANNKDNLLLENATWTNVTGKPDMKLTGRYFRYKVIIPYGEKLYWLRKRINTLETYELLPYIKSIHMTGKYKARDEVARFTNTEAFEIPKDGKYHTIVKRVSDIIGADVIEKGFQLSEVERVDLQCTTPDVTLNYNPGLNSQYPYHYLNVSIKAKSSIDYEVAVKNTPYIFTEKNDEDEDIIVIKGTPQQYAPITVEDVNGIPYRQVFTDSFLQTETFIITEETKYVELMNNQFDKLHFLACVDENLIGDNTVGFELLVNSVRLMKNEYAVYINNATYQTKIDGKDITAISENGSLDCDAYKVVNNLVIFTEPVQPGHIVKIHYKIPYTFIADIDRENNTTVIKLYTGNGNQTPEKCKVFFETGKKNNKFIADKLSLNPIYRTDYKGFIYLTDEHNEPFKVNIYCNPMRLKAGGYDKVDISVEVLDIMDNPVISKDVAIDCEYGILNCENHSTDMNGVVHLVYESSYTKCVDKVVVKVLTDDGSVIEKSISIINE